MKIADVIYIQSQVPFDQLKDTVFDILEDYWPVEETYLCLQVRPSIAVEGECYLVVTRPNHTPDVAMKLHTYSPYENIYPLPLDGIEFEKLLDLHLTLVGAEDDGHITLGVGAVYA